MTTARTAAGVCVKARVTVIRVEGGGVAYVAHLTENNRLALGGAPTALEAKANALAFVEALRRGINQAEG